MMGLTPKERQALDYIRDYAALKGYAPSYTEIMTAIGAKSKSRAYELIRLLVERGAIRKSDRRARSIQIIEPIRLCPHCGGDISAAPLTHKPAQQMQAERERLT